MKKSVVLSLVFRKLVVYLYSIIHTLIFKTMNTEQTINESKQELIDKTIGMSQEQLESVLEFINDLNKRRNQNGLGDINQEEILTFVKKL